MRRTVYIYGSLTVRVTVTGGKGFADDTGVASARDSFRTLR